MWCIGGHQDDPGDGQRHTHPQHRADVGKTDVQFEDRDDGGHRNRAAKDDWHDQQSVPFAGHHRRGQAQRPERTERSRQESPLRRRKVIAGEAERVAFDFHHHQATRNGDDQVGDPNEHIGLERRPTGRRH